MVEGRFCLVWVGGSGGEGRRGGKDEGEGEGGDKWGASGVSVSGTSVDYLR